LRTRYVTFALLALVLSRPASAQTGCSVLQQNLFVRDVMSDIYLWRDQIPDLDPARFDSPEAYLEAIRFRPTDDAFSYIANRAATEALFSSSEYVGFGFSTLWQGDSLRISQVFPGSPAFEAGISRGDQVVEVNGRTVPQLLEAGDIGQMFGPAEAGVTVDLVLHRAGTVHRVHVVKRPVTIPSVSDVHVFERSGRRVGYLFFRNFVEPSVAALDEAFGELRRQRVDELVLDLRYNGGGLVNVAQHLGGLLGGTLTTGQVFAEYVHNDRNRFRNRTLRFTASKQALTLNRVFAITTRASASASELVINALRPFMPVVTIGDRTYGKPVGQYMVPFCDRVLAPVSFTLRNANGEGDFFDGFLPTCPAADDLEHGIGDVAEASLREAFVVMESGRCTVGLEERLPRIPERAVPRSRGWSAIVGAD
jgi:carboxyl-terminal processing protease